jgi:metallophosphoesterase superfamily enzyme
MLKSLGGSKMDRFSDGALTFHGDSRRCRVSLCGRSLYAEATGALYWPDEALLVVADLDLAATPLLGERGGFAPPADPRARLGALSRACVRSRAQTVVVLGGPVRHGSLEDAIDSECRERLRELVADCGAWLWVGDQGAREAARTLGGEACQAIRINGFTIRHRPFTGPITHEIAGCYRPAARIVLGGYDMKRPCFVANGRRIVLPAFATHSGGNNVLCSAFLPLFGSDGLKVWIIGHDGIEPLAGRQLRPDAMAA